MWDKACWRKHFCVFVCAYTLPLGWAHSIYVLGKDHSQSHSKNPVFLDLQRIPVITALNISQTPITLHNHMLVGTTRIQNNYIRQFYSNWNSACLYVSLFRERFKTIEGSFCVFLQQNWEELMLLNVTYKVILQDIKVDFGLHISHNNLLIRSRREPGSIVNIKWHYVTDLNVTCRDNHSFKTNQVN